MATPPSPDVWKRVTQLTAEALERPAEERATWLDRECAGDDVLRREVESLLAADALAGGFLDSAALAEDGAAAAVADAARASQGLGTDRMVGPYRIVRELGHGGMGVVYLAARADEAFEKNVAIKVVRGGFAHDIVMQRFRDERRILATLDHPHIARLLDAGTTADGVSYLVMEYVDGVAVDEYCETAGLSLPARLRLFGQICAAVQYAHQHLVIHRDIKARNILVTADGTPKLLDFGIAKLLATDVADEQTRTQLRAFTLEHASPEQIRGEPMTVTSDVYALGVLLYQLITGQRPYGSQPMNDAALIRAICDDPPVSPAVAARSGTRVDVSAELEWVILKALRKEPGRRYGTVEQLADDVRRFLAALPVLAAPDSRRYRARKFVARHRLAVTVSALLALSLIVGVTATLWQARRAEEQRALAETRLQNTRRLANSMVFELNDALEAGSTSARTLLLTRASEQLDALAADAPGDPVLAEELATAYHRLGNALGKSSAAHVGDRPAGLANHRKGLAIRKRLAATAPGNLEARFRLVSSLVDTAFAEDEVEPSFEHAKAAVSVAEGLATDRPTDVRVRARLAAALYALGSQYRAIGDNAHAFENFERAAPLYDEVYKVRPDANVRRELALSHKRLGAILVEQEQFPKALRHLQTAVELDEASVAENPRAGDSRRDLSTSNTQLGWALMNAGDPKGALVAYHRALDLREVLFKEDPTNVLAPRDVATALWYIGVAETRLGDFGAAIGHLRRAISLLDVAPRKNDEYNARFGGALATAYERSGRDDLALEVRRRVFQERQALLLAQPGNKTYRWSLAQDAVALGGTLTARRGRDAAAPQGPGREACSALEVARRAVAGLTDSTVSDSRIREQLRESLTRCPAVAEDRTGGTR